MVALRLLWCTPALRKSMSATGNPSSAQIRRLSPKAQTKWSVSRRSDRTDFAEDRVASWSELTAAGVTSLPSRNVADYRSLSKSRERLWSR